MKNIKTASTFLVLLLLTTTLSAQNNNPDFLRSIGKIYVVVGVIVAIFIGIIAYLFSLDKKVRDLEKQMKD
ncbi:MAG: CcmD family protein [Bacteroidota bacterium]